MGRILGAVRMKVEVRMCDVCRAEVDQHWPINLSANRDSSPTGEHLNVDLCSVGCLWSYVATFEPSESVPNE